MNRDGAALPAGRGQRGQEGPRSGEAGAGRRRGAQSCHQWSGNSKYKGREGRLDGEQHELKMEEVVSIL